MNILPKIRTISTFQEYVQTLKRAGINEDAIAEICECGSAISIQLLYDLSLAAVWVIKAFADEGIHELELVQFYHLLAMNDNECDMKKLQKSLDYAENCTKRIETYIANQEVFNET